MNMARARKVIFALIGLLVVAQFIQPKRTNPPVIPPRSLAANIRVPVPVQGILKRACGDCHSNQTVWPWYSHIAPLSWVIVDDVNEGRRHMNFDDWENRQRPKLDNDLLADICKEVKDKGMPPFSYRLMHKSSRLTPKEIGPLCAWSQSFGTVALPRFEMTP